MTKKSTRLLSVAASVIVVAALLWILPTPLNWVVAVAATVVLNWAIPRLLDAVLESATDQSPLSASVEKGPIRYEHRSSTPQDFLFGSVPDALPQAPPEWEEDRSPWAYALGAVDADSTEVQIVIEALHDQAVLLRGLRVNVVQREKPLHGHVLRQVAGDLVDVRYADVDLDASPPKMALGSGYTEGQGEWNFPLTVTEDQPEVLHIFATTARYFCSWTADLLYTYKGEDGILRIDDDGVPFRTTSTQNAVEYVLLADGSVVSQRDLQG